jgi:hypothetical protein
MRLSSLSFAAVLLLCSFALAQHHDTPAPPPPPPPPPGGRVKSSANYAERSCCACARVACQRAFGSE